MKKGLSLLLAFILMFSVLSVTAAAEGETATEQQEKSSVHERFDNYLREKDSALMDYYDRNQYSYPYKELFEHKNGDETDWVLLYAEIGAIEPWNACCLIGNRVLIGSTRDVFSFCYGLYDAREDTFYDLAKMKDYRLYPELDRALDTYVTGGAFSQVSLMGDLDNDDTIDITDATIIQRCEAGIREYPENDLIDPYQEISYYYTSHPTYYSDFNRDGDRNIIDATAIQRYLVYLT